MDDDQEHKFRGKFYSLVDVDDSESWKLFTIVKQKMQGIFCKNISLIETGIKLIITSSLILTNFIHFLNELIFYFNLLFLQTSIYSKFFLLWVQSIRGKKYNGLQCDNFENNL